MHRRTLLKTAGATLLASPAVAQPAVTATLRLVPQANLTALDPIFTTAIVTNNHAYHVFDTLYSCAADGVPKPQMAEGHEVSADGLTWRIRLRAGLTFHDGTPVRGVVERQHPALVSARRVRSAPGQGGRPMGRTR